MWYFLSENSPSSPEVEVESWEGDSWDGAPCALLRSIPIHDQCCSPDRKTDALIDSPYGMTSEHSTGECGKDPSTSCQEVSPARTSASLEVEEGSAVHAAACGAKWPELFAKLDHASSSWRTPQHSLSGGLDEFCGTWPKWGLMRRGECIPLAMLAHSTGVIGCGSLPTPTRYGNGGTGGTKKMQRLGMNRTRLNPNHQEWLMLWPQGWTALTPLATGRFQAWLLLHGDHS